VNQLRDVRDKTVSFIGVLGLFQCFDVSLDYLAR
jgi:hypothetical protein